VPWDSTRQVLRDGEWDLKHVSKEAGKVVLVLRPVVAEDGLEEEEEEAVGSGGLAAEVSVTRRSKLF
jgi:hypothetical protein